MSCNNTNKTLTFDESVKGWTSFHSFLPDFMVNMNNNFYTFKNGNLYLHHSDDADRNTYYGVPFASKLEVMVNESPSDIKEFQAMSFEGNTPWEVLVKSFVSNIDDFKQTTITAAEFVKKEGMWYAYARRNEIQDFESKATYGIGEVASIDVPNLTVIVDGFSTLITAEDSIIRGDDLTEVGNIVSITKDYENNQTVIVLDGLGTLSGGEFLVGIKDSRIEGGNLRGYTLKYELESNAVGKVELFAVNTEVMKSYT